MIRCPQKNHPDWIALEELTQDENESYKIFIKNDYYAPTQPFTKESLHLRSPRLDYFIGKHGEFEGLRHYFGEKAFLKETKIQKGSKVSNQSKINIKKKVDKYNDKHKTSHFVNFEPFSMHYAKVGQIDISLKPVNQQKKAERLERRKEARSGDGFFENIQEEQAKQGEQLSLFQLGNPIKEGVSELFESNPELATIGSKIQYSQYLDTIFPDSKVKEIVYHGTLPENKFEKFDKQRGTNLSGEYGGIHFGDLTTAKERPTKVIQAENFLLGVEGDLANFRPNIIPVILNISNIKRVEEGKNWGQGDWNKLISKEQEADAFIYSNKIENKGKDSYVVFEPEQIHILGSKQDIENFANFVSYENSSYSKIGSIQQFKDYIMSKNFAAVEEFLVVNNKIDRKC